MKLTVKYWVVSACFMVLLSTASQSFAQFVYTGNLRHARAHHTATLLQNGMVLVAGGRNTDGSATNTAELYDPATGAFAYTGNLQQARFGHTATLLPNGLVLIVGGVSYGSLGRWYGVAEANLSSAELYNPATGTFIATGPMYEGRSHHTAILLATGQVLITGGVTSSHPGCSSTAELYEPATGVFHFTGPLTCRMDHQATLLPNGQVLITGGAQRGYYQNLCYTQASARLYTPYSGSFDLTGDMRHDSGVHTATLLSNGNVLVSGGINNDCETIDRAELYDPTTATFSYTGFLQHDRQYHTATLLPNGQVLVTGGLNRDFHTIRSAELYTPSTATFAYTANLQHDRAYHTATLLQNGKVLIVGGTNDDKESSILAEVYTLPPPPPPPPPPCDPTTDPSCGCDPRFELCPICEPNLDPNCLPITESVPTRPATKTPVPKKK